MIRCRIGLVCAAMAAALACSPDAAAPRNADFELSITPSPPVLGEAALSLRLTGPDGLLRGARVKIEGNMNHAGMKPSFVSLEEVEPGLYVGDFTFTMAGDWLLIATAETEDGLSLERVIEVPGVRSP